MKTNETLIIEEMLLNSCFGANPKLAKYYGSKEVTIGFARNKVFETYKKEIVDFMAYDAANEDFRCYEIKVSLADLKSDAAKSWYGHYNYLVIPESLYDKVEDFNTYLPIGVGLIVCDIENRTMKTVKRPVRKIISAELVDELKNSLIRSLFYKVQNKKEK